MTHFYRNVPKLGNVAVSRHAQKRMAEDEIPQEAFERVLLTPVKQDIRDGADILWRERHTDCDTGESHPLDWCQVAPSFADPVAEGFCRRDIGRRATSILHFSLPAGKNSHPTAENHLSNCRIIAR